MVTPPYSMIFWQLFVAVVLILPQSGNINACEIRIISLTDNHLELRIDTETVDKIEAILINGTNIVWVITYDPNFPPLADTATIKVGLIDDSSPGSAFVTVTTVNGGVCEISQDIPDSTPPPICELADDPAPTSTFAQLSFFAATGIQNINVDSSSNVIITIPAFAVGDLGPVGVSVNLIDPTSPGQACITVTDVTGAKSQCCVELDGDFIDSDDDGVPDDEDQCPGFDDNADADLDGVPDACDTCPGFDDNLDDDGDGVPDDCDNCPNDANPGQEDADSNGVGDACDPCFNDTEPPVISCPGDISQGTDPGVCEAVVSFAATATDNCTDTASINIVCDPPSGSIFPKGDTVVICTATDESGNQSECSFTVTIVDDEAPVVSCAESVNPHGKNKPRAGRTLPRPKGGQNEDGFYELLAVFDNCDGLEAIQLFVKDSGSGTVFGPFSTGDKIKYTEDGNATPESKKMGSSKGEADAIAAHIIGNGDAQIFGVDSAGNISDPVDCLVPPSPK